MSPPLRVLHCPTVVGGHPSALARAERGIGLDSRAVSLADNVYGYDVDETLWQPGDPRPLQELARLRLLRRALSDYDVVHFNFGMSLAPPRVADWEHGGRAWRAVAHAYDLYARALEHRDLPLLRRAGKVVAVTYQGDDARQGDASLERFGLSIAHELGQDYYPAGSDALKRRSIAAFDRHAQLIYAVNPDLLHVLPARARFLPYGHVDVRAHEVVPPTAAGPPVIAHAPTHRGVKGTRHVLAALERLRAEGLEHELLLIEGLPHAEAMRRYARADLVVDQLLAGWYGGVAVELMALGKPVVAYLRPEDLAFLPEGMRAELPVLSATPESIEAVLRELLTTRRGELPALGAAARAYAERRHDQRRIAEGLRADYERAAATAGRDRRSSRSRSHSSTLTARQAARWSRHSSRRRSSSRAAGS